MHILAETRRPTVTSQTVQEQIFASRTGVKHKTESYITHNCPEGPQQQPMLFLPFQVLRLGVWHRPRVTVGAF